MHLGGRVIKNGCNLSTGGQLASHLCLHDSFGIRVFRVPLEKSCKSVVSPYIFTVNILFLIVDTLRVQVQKKHSFVGMVGGWGGGGVGGWGGGGGGGGVVVHGGPLWPTA